MISVDSGPLKECTYEFQVWQPDANELMRMRNLEVQFSNFTNYVQKELLSFQLTRSLDAGSYRNWSATHERTLTDLKTDQLEKYIQVQELKAKLEQIEMKIEHLREKIQAKASKHSHKKKHVRMVPSLAQADTQRHQGIEHLKSMISDLKAEWILLKRDLIHLRDENDDIKKIQSEIINSTKGIRTWSDQVKGMFSAANIKDSLLDSALATVNKVIDQIQHDLLVIKANQQKIKDDIEKHATGLVALQASTADMRQGFMEIQLANKVDTLQQIVSSIAQPQKGAMQLQQAPSATQKNPDDNVIKFPEVKSLRENEIPKDCSDIVGQGHTMNGVYKVKVAPILAATEVYCSIEDGVGFTVIQRRVDGLQDFGRGWLEYKYGFGNVYGEFWMGNEIIRALTKDNDYGLRIDLWDWEGNVTNAEYDVFSVSNEEGRYALHVSGYHGNAGDSLSYHDGMKFSTKDLDNDIHHRNCAAENNGGWWFSDCYYSHLNGRYHVGWYAQAKYTFADGIVWYTLKESERYSLRKVEMKLKKHKH
ncbi:hypothetical protein DPMN_110661 [Dreissena polymorpha]|uniref:Fibrinogen C-terminal domain-containing protein n=1 Tax=Dreissena polymorpha TaxID=45954 RepID=A0A9D4KCT9_DREPO|nr:hypothetical protein DPMN_110661 [Dreissena polymorpha]